MCLAKSKEYGRVCDTRLGERQVAMASCSAARREVGRAAGHGAQELGVGIMESSVAREARIVFVEILQWHAAQTDRVYCVTTLSLSDWKLV